MRFGPAALVDDPTTSPLEVAPEVKIVGYLLDMARRQELI
jgi:hypothetical protein